MRDYRGEALSWHAERPDFPVSVFACRFPGHYADAAAAIRVVKRLDPNAALEDSIMALSTEQQLELKTAEHNATVRDLLKTVELLDYYRSQVTQTNGSRSRPPAGFWIKEGKSGYVWGMLSDGDLIPKGKAADYESTVEACWAHYDKLHEGAKRHLTEPRPSTAHIKRRKAPEKAPPKEPEHEEVDLTDMAEADDEAEEEPAPPVRSRRRRIVRD